MTAERKYGQPFSYKPFTRLVFSANTAPGTNDQSDAYYARWLVLPMSRQRDEAVQDRHLVECLTDPAELEGILAAAVQGLRELMARGHFDPPAPMREAGEEYRASTDTIIGFVRARCVLAEEASETETVLLEDYSSWCRDGNRHPLGRENFRERLVETVSGVEFKRRYHGYPTFFGIRPRTHLDDAPKLGDLGDQETFSEIGNRSKG